MEFDLKNKSTGMYCIIADYAAQRVARMCPMEVMLTNVLNEDNMGRAYSHIGICKFNECQHDVRVKVCERLSRALNFTMLRLCSESRCVYGNIS